MMSKDSTILHEIQYLRAVAVMMVVYGHFAFWVRPQGFFPYFDSMGHTGVDMFFVISGYVVSSVLFSLLILNPDMSFIHNLENNVGRLKAFFVRRLFRLFPLVPLLAIANITFYLFYPDTLFPPGITTNVKEEILGVLSNLSMQSDMDLVLFFPAGHMPIRIVSQYWTLAVEERFYLLFPLIMLLLCDVRRIMMFAVAVIIGLGAFKALMPYDRDAMYLNGFLRFDAFMFGILVYLLGKYTKVLSLVFNGKCNLVAMNAFSILLLIMAAREPVIRFDASYHLFFEGNAYYYICVYLLSSILIAMAAQDKGYVLKIPVVRHVLFWIGEKSYTIYVFHLFFLALAQKIAGGAGIGKEHWLRVGAIYLVLMTVLVEIIFRFWEYPWRNKGKRIAHGIVTAVDR